MNTSVIHCSICVWLQTNLSFEDSFDSYASDEVEPDYVKSLQDQQQPVYHPPGLIWTNNLPALKQHAVNNPTKKKHQVFKKLYFVKTNGFLFSVLINSHQKGKMTSRVMKKLMLNTTNKQSHSLWYLAQLASLAAFEKQDNSKITVIIN